MNCLGYRTEFGKKRFNSSLHKITPNKNAEVYKIIDTTKLYRIESSISIVDGTKLNNSGNVYLKFYAENKVGIFYDFDINDINSLNPKKADVGVFNFIDNKFIIEKYFEKPQYSGYLKEVFLINRNTKEFLELISDKYIDKYKIQELPMEFLIYKPDW